MPQIRFLKCFRVVKNHYRDSKITCQVNSNTNIGRKEEISSRQLPSDLHVFAVPSILMRMHGSHFHNYNKNCTKTQFFFE